MQNDDCIYLLGDNMYRFLALIASVLLMAGLLSLGNSKTRMQVAFAGCYILLNILYWAVSAVGPTKSVWGHWKTRYESKILPYVKPTSRTPSQAHYQTHPIASSHNIHEDEKAIPFSERQDSVDLEGPNPKAPWRPSLIDRFLGQLDQKRRMNAYFNRLDQAKSERQSTTFTEAVWTAIALTGSTKWFKEMDICPDTEPWNQWLEEAEKRAAPRRNNDGQLVSACTINDHGQIELPGWDWHGRLSALHAKTAPKRIPELSNIVTLQRAARGDIRAFSPFVRSQLRNQAQRARQRVSARYQVSRDLGFVL